MGHHQDAADKIVRGSVYMCLVCMTLLMLYTAWDSMNEGIIAAARAHTSVYSVLIFVDIMWIMFSLVHVCVYFWGRRNLYHVDLGSHTGDHDIHVKTLLYSSIIELSFLCANMIVLGTIQDTDMSKQAIGVAGIGCMGVIFGLKMSSVVLTSP